MSILRVDSIRDRAGTGSPDFSNGVTFSGNVSIGGTLTYEDVTNIDSVGIVTARGGLVTRKMLKEEVNVTSGTLSANPNIYLENGCVHIFTSKQINNIYSSY